MTRGHSCNARSRNDLCGSLDCRTCHPENFDDDGVPMPACERCGEFVEEVDENGICKACRILEEEGAE